MDFKDTVKTLEEMGVENAIERAKEFGKLPKAKKEDGELRQRLSEKDTIEEQQKKMMKKMVEDILTKKSKDSSDVIKNTGVSKILKKNLQVIKNIADKEGISINTLIKALKSSDE
jgi:translation initiation factor 2 beta subunit (eIF-2beta)/eIF-5